MIWLGTHATTDKREMGGDLRQQRRKQYNHRGRVWINGGTSRECQQPLEARRGKDCDLH